jgi:hypothetical protein
MRRCYCPFHRGWRGGDGHDSDSGFSATMKIMAQGRAQWISVKMKGKKGPLLMVAHRRQLTTSGEVQKGCGGLSTAGKGSGGVAAEQTTSKRGQWLQRRDEVGVVTW